ncbi:hypothetical protein EB796_023189 [Bugula neritina]|uniref:CWH43-like N-terminal domain-containing protein n=1 Tax=Bugula neritina TaxID=10212 RepID=A0A7J7IYN5_BUGNE|nr:hypothetical protein EB796_023189 [Bugula neritina]
MSNKHCSSSRYLFLLPLITCLAFPITFVISYGYSIANKNVNSTGDFPYISETGTKPPESCVFGQLLNIAAVISGLTIYVRYRQTHQAFKHLIPSSSKNNYRWNTAALVVGMCASLGVSMVGNFQMDNLLIAHYIGAGLAFVLGTVYSWMQVYLSYSLLVYMCSRAMFYFRIVCSFITTLFLIGTLVGAQLYQNNNKQVLSYRLLSTISEWIMALGLAVLFATFASEFKATKVEKPRISIIQEKLSSR